MPSKPFFCECEFVLPSSATKSRNRLLVFVFWRRPASHLPVQPWPFLLIYLLSLFQLCTILFIIDWCLRFLFLLQRKVIHKGIVPSLHPSSFCLGLASSPSGIVLLMYSYIYTKDLSVSFKSYQISECVFDSTIRPSVLAFVLFDWFIGLFSLYPVEESDCGQRQCINS